MPSYFGLFDEIMSHSDKEQPVIGKNFSYELPKNYQGIYDAKVHGTRIPWMLRKVEILQRIYIELLKEWVMYKYSNEWEINKINTS